MVLPVSVSVEVRSVSQPRHLHSRVTGIEKDGISEVTNALLTVYTGILTVTLDESEDDLQRFNISSYLLLNVDDAKNEFKDDTRIFDYAGDGDLLIDAVAYATVCTFASAPETCGIDFVFVQLEDHMFRDGTTRTVPVINVEAALQDGKIHSIAYHVTTLSQFRAPELKNLPIHQPEGLDRPRLKFA